MIDYANAIFETSRSALINPKTMHIPLEDGGHLLVMPKRRVSDRTKLQPVELLEIEYLSIMGAAVLKHFLNAEWFNYQENGNWVLDTAKEPHMHLHVYGRKRNSKTQRFGEALRFPLRKDKESMYFPSFDRDQIADIREWINLFQQSDVSVDFVKAIEYLS